MVWGHFTEVNGFANLNGFRAVPLGVVRAVPAWYSESCSHMAWGDGHSSFLSQQENVVYILYNLKTT